MKEIVTYELEENTRRSVNKDKQVAGDQVTSQPTALCVRRYRIYGAKRWRRGHDSALLPKLVWIERNHGFTEQRR